jgi:hypothetical protein
MTKCCDRKSKKQRTFGCQKCTLIFITVLACGAIGGGEFIVTRKPLVYTLIKRETAWLITDKHVVHMLMRAEQILVVCRCRFFFQEFPRTLCSHLSEFSVKNIQLSYSLMLFSSTSCFHISLFFGQKSMTFRINEKFLCYFFSQDYMATTTCIMDWFKCSTLANSLIDSF